MPAKNPRINVVLEKSLYQRVRFLAKKDRVSLSTKVRDLLRDAIELDEDRYLVSLAEEREAAFTKKSALSHEETWS